MTVLYGTGCGKDIWKKRHEWGQYCSRTNKKSHCVTAKGRKDSLERWYKEESLGPIIGRWAEEGQVNGDSRFQARARWKMAGHCPKDGGGGAVC
jgi:hypothetical protein